MRATCGVMLVRQCTLPISRSCTELEDGTSKPIRRKSLSRRHQSLPTQDRRPHPTTPPTLTGRIVRYSKSSHSMFAMCPSSRCAEREKHDRWARRAAQHEAVCEQGADQNAIDRRPPTAPSAFRLRRSDNYHRSWRHGRRRARGNDKRRSEFSRSPPCRIRAAGTRPPASGRCRG